METLKQTYKLHCEWLSPIHIGTGDVLEPFDYIIKNGRFYRVSFGDALGAMSQEDRRGAEELMDSGRLADLRKYVAEKIDPKKKSIYSTAVRHDVAKQYETKLSDVNNQLLIHPFFRSTRHKVPVLPGSSIKGAIRTAVISQRGIDSRLPKPQCPRDWFAMEQNIMGYKDAKDDPFRALSIRDAAVAADSTVVANVRNASLKKNILRVNNIGLVFEVGHSRISGKAVAVEAEAFVDEALNKCGEIKKPIDFQEVINACKAFYQPKMEEEHNKFYRGRGSVVEPYSEQLLAISYGSNSFPLRIGRFSGVESVTLDKYRDPRPPGNKTVWGRSRNLAESLYPMGWMKVTVR